MNIKLETLLYWLREKIMKLEYKEPYLEEGVILLLPCHRVDKPPVRDPYKTP